MTTVGDIMTASLFSIEPTTTVAEAATVMGERRIGSALVMEDAHFDAAGHAVSEWMTADPITVPPSTPAKEALGTMLARGFRHLPVADGESVLGIVSMRDLTAAGVTAPDAG
jgi:signal-transduction protein with cAMP-binding, CBS, and nucleotidyltransferase domain